jgi:hypothetical protein
VALGAEASTGCAPVVALVAEANAGCAPVAALGAAASTGCAPVVALVAEASAGFAPVAVLSAEVSAEYTAAIVIPRGPALAVEPAVMLGAASRRGAELDNLGGETRPVEIAVESPLLDRATV